MLQSKLFYKTTKPARNASPTSNASRSDAGWHSDAGGNKSASTDSISHDLLTRAGYIDQLMAGVYSFLPLGFKVLKNIESVIRRNMEAVGGQEILMPVLQPKENWVKTGRWDALDILFKVKGSGDKEYAMGPTHEEVVAPLAKKVVFSYRDLPFSVFQIQTKFRDELRAKSGILRTREFLMKDLYSFHATQADFDAYYEKLAKVYANIFKEVGLGKITYRTLASGGSFSKYSDEFQTLTNAGEDVIYICKKCGASINKEIKAKYPVCPKCKAKEFEEKKSIEVGNIFPLGTGFSAPFNLKFTDKDAQEKPVIMGCYGIGLGRLMGAIVEASHDDKGIIWPKSVAPFLIHLIQVGNNPKIKKAAEKLYKELSRSQSDRGSSTKSGQNSSISVLYDDRQEKSAGEKFADADLMGIPFRVIVSERTLKENLIELRERNKNSTKLVKIKSLMKLFHPVK